MSYYNAKIQLKDNFSHLATATRDPVMFNLSSALYNLTEQLERDHHNLQQRLRRLEEDMKRVRVALRT
jgi:hypothetical protein